MSCHNHGYYSRRVPFPKCLSGTSDVKASGHQSVAGPALCLPWTRQSHICLTQHFPKCQTDFNFNLLFSLDSSNMHRVRSIGWLCSYALYFPVWFMLQKTYLFLLNFFLQFLLKIFYWGITALHCCVSAVQQSEPVIHIWISPPSWNSLLHPPSHTINFLDIYLHFTHDSLTCLCYKIFCLEQIMLVKFMPEYITPWKINNRAGMLC